MDFQEVMWGYRQSSDVISRVSSDGSSFLNNPRMMRQQQHANHDEEESDIEVRFLLQEMDRMKDMTTKPATLEDNNTVSTRESPKSVMDMSCFSSEPESTINNSHLSEPEGGPVASHSLHEHSSSHPHPPRRKATRTIVGSRRQRKRQIHSLATTTWACWESTLVCGSIVPYESPNSQPQQQEATVLVEATALCDLDLRQQRQATLTQCQESLQDSILCSTKEAVGGTNLVGVIHKGNATLDSLGFPSGTRVAAVVPRGAHARYAHVPHRLLHKVPKHLDSADVAAIVATYLPAFCALHHGQPRPQRYSRTYLRGKRLLITHCTSLEAQAVVRCAQLAGCKEITITVPHNYTELPEMNHVTILNEDDEEEWARQVKGQMDVVLDYQFPNHFAAVKASVAKKGRLVCQSQASSLFANQSCTSYFQLEKLMEYWYLLSVKRATLFNFADELRRYKGVQEDLDHLLQWLSKRHVRPEIDSFIGLSEVPSALDAMEQRSPYGSIICEPWKE